MGKGASRETYGCARVLTQPFVCVRRRLSITDTSLFLTMQFSLSQSPAARLPSLGNPLWPTLAVAHHHQLDVWEFITSLDGVLCDVCFWLGVLVGVCLPLSACHKAIFMIAHAILAVRSACSRQGYRLCCSVQACESQLMEAILCTALWDRKYCWVFCGRKLLFCFMVARVCTGLRFRRQRECGRLSEWLCFHAHKYSNIIWYMVIFGLCKYHVNTCAWLA